MSAMLVAIAEAAFVSYLQSAFAGAALFAVATIMHAGHWNTLQQMEFKIDCVTTLQLRTGIRWPSKGKWCEIRCQLCGMKPQASERVYLHSNVAIAGRGRSNSRHDHNYGL